MNHQAHPADVAASFRHHPPVEHERRETLMTLALELRKVHGERYAKQWLAQQLKNFPAPDISSTPNDPDAFDLAFDATRVWSTKNTDILQEHIPAGPLELYRQLNHYSCADMHLRGYKRTAFQHEFFCVGEALYLTLGLARATFYRYLDILRNVGLVDARGHCTTVSTFGSRCDGTIFAVKLNPRRIGNAHVTFAHLKAQGYRDLEEDIAEQRTFWQLRQSTNGEYKPIETICGVLRWISSQCKSLKGECSKPRYLTVSLESKTGLEAVLAVTKGLRKHRGGRIAGAVRATANALGDQHSVPFWWRFYDALARHAETGGTDYAPRVHLALERERAAKEEGFARNAAALFIARLKRSGVYSLIMH